MLFQLTPTELALIVRGLELLAAEMRGDDPKKIVPGRHQVAEDCHALVRRLEEIARDE